jgi:hypothetical protein
MLDKFRKENYNIQIGSSWFLPALTLLFVYLKLTGEIAWSWWWVLAPLWIPALIGFTIAFVIAFIVAFKK